VSVVLPLGSVQDGRDSSLIVTADLQVGLDPAGVQTFPPADGRSGPARAIRWGSSLVTSLFAGEAAILLPTTWVSWCRLDRRVQSQELGPALSQLDRPVSRQHVATAGPCQIPSSISPAPASSRGRRAHWPVPQHVPQGSLTGRDAMSCRACSALTEATCAWGAL